MIIFKNLPAIAMSFSFLLLAGIPIVHSDETITEKAGASSNNVKRGIKKGAHRAEEIFCAASDTECAARKAGNRIIEAKDATVDAAVKMKNKVD